VGGAMLALIVARIRSLRSAEALKKLLDSCPGVAHNGLMTNNTHFLTRTRIDGGTRITETLLFDSYRAMDDERYKTTSYTSAWNIDWGRLPKVDEEANTIRF
jgi:hypothetical protein